MKQHTLWPGQPEDIRTIMNAINSYPYLPESFPALIECALQMLGKHRSEAESTFVPYLTHPYVVSEEVGDPIWIQITLADGHTDLGFSFDLKQQCEYSFVFLRGPVPQLGDCVRYFSANWNYGSRYWRLGDVVVKLDKVDDEVSCQFSAASALFL